MMRRSVQLTARRWLPLLATVLPALFLSTEGVFAGDGAEPAYRTDADQDTELPWFQLVEGEFPPPGSAHAFGGELIAVDAVNRTGTLRVDRTDAQRRSHWDLPVDFQLLPYGTLSYHGAPAALADIPLGTHLHGLFYQRAPDQPPAKTVFHNRASIEAEFTRCLQLEDDFSHWQRQGRAWRIEAADLESKTLTLLPVDAEGKSIGEESKTFEWLPATRLWIGDRLGVAKDVAVGQVVQINLTWATLYGPGRCLDIWLDAKSRQAAQQRQLAVHRQYQKERGLAGWIDAVDNSQSLLTVTLFGGVDPDLLTEFVESESVTSVVAEPSLRSYDQVNDRKGGSLLKITTLEPMPGSSGVQLLFRTDLLLEGFRPRRIVRVFPAGWPVISLPQEERLWPARD